MGQGGSFGFCIYTQVNLDNVEKEADNTNKLSQKPQQTLQMQGNVIVKTRTGKCFSDNVLLDLLKQHATLEGLDTSKEGRIRVEANLSDLETNRGKKETEPNHKTPVRKLLKIQSPPKFFC
ncbi:MAG: hypothetical protein Ct9H300mP28_28430 [Pseudomonadota bacterium]|nr:MAG: hypothetical protein Ct9H300mP28_28430 [Pseudomonadota bacterium]